MEMSVIEWIAVVCSLAYVWLLGRERLWAWPFAIIGSALSMLVMFDTKLYLDTALYVVYVIMGAYGWYLWVYGDRHRPSLPITHTGVKQALLLLGLGVAGTIGFGYVFSEYTDAAIPYWDAFTTSFSLVGTWMQVRKQLENWLLWLVVDAVYIGVYAYKGLMGFAILSGIYLLLATYAYLNWRKRYRVQQMG